MFDETNTIGKAVNTFLHGAKKLGKMAADGIQKVNESELFQNLKTDLRDRINNSETLSNVKNEVRQWVRDLTSQRSREEKKNCPQCGALVDTGAKFCAEYGADQPMPQEAAAAPEEEQETAAACHTDYFEACPTVLEDKEEAVPDIFGFQPK